MLMVIIILPKQPSGYYKEFVHPTSGISGPGAQRIVTGANGEVWFSPPLNLV